GWQFGIDGFWTGYRSSTGDFSLTARPYEPAPDANTDRDNDDNGTRQADADSAFNIVSGLIELRPDSEPDTAVDGDGRDSNLTIDFGIFQLASVGNRVWNDLNANGIAEAGEEGVSGVTVRLYRSDDTLVGTVVTGSDGSYLFTDLPPGNYYIEFGLPEGWVFSPQGQGSDSGSDSDVDPNMQRTQVFTLTSGQNDLSWWAGIHRAPPTAITLLSFTAERQSNGVLLRWVTGSERDTLGFVILRSASGNRADAAQIVATPIPAQGSAGAGASYQWLDRTAQPNVSYHYWLVEIEIDGSRNEFALHSPALQFTYRVLLPIIQR
ncbi:SdrD B-like domain-containing protein, partial [Chloroflexus sp.]|uniref:SdrD B-like domain-containing protein n=1 Tax=Chloroflexus sp. TaxID=1904827 RepID=UPI002ACD5397